MNKPYENWATAMSSQIDFYESANRKTRVDDDIDWSWYYSMMSLRKKISLYIRPVLKRIHKKKYLTLDFKKNWFIVNAELLWNARASFEDDLSRKEFDSFLITAICGFEKFYYSRLHFDEIITIVKESEFTEDLPKLYMGLQLKSYDILVRGAENPQVNIVSAKEEIDVTNKYKRYFTERNGTSFIPNKGDVVFDCGSCIGEISMVFAAMVGKTGSVHLFDPIPLHNKYSELQISNNPSLDGVLSIHQLGISNVSKKYNGKLTDVTTISPGGCAIDNFDLVSIDDFVSDKNIDRLDYIKMDIEGAELDALEGAALSIKKFGPKLAISSYHQGSHLWEIPELILKLNPNYKIFFEQHLPVECDALIYAYIPETITQSENNLVFS